VIATATASLPHGVPLAPAAFCDQYARASPSPTELLLGDDTAQEQGARSDMGV
jgi:hypothetical protein